MWSSIQKHLEDLQKDGEASARYRLARLILRRRLLWILSRSKRCQLEQRDRQLRQEVTQLRAAQEQKFSFARKRRLDILLGEWRDLSDEFEAMEKILH